MTDERLLCRCPLPCEARATQEDFRCDTCRLGFTEHVHIGPVGSGPHVRTKPVRTYLAETRLRLAP